MKYTTGLPTPKFADLLIRLREEGVEGYPPSLGLRDSLRAALIYMRHNEPFSPGTAVRGWGSAWWCGKDWVGWGWCARGPVRDSVF